MSPAVPISALREERGETVVYAVIDNKLARLAVKTGTRNEDEAWVEIVQGLQPGVKVVKTNLGALNSGVTVRLAGDKGSSSPSAPAAPPATPK